MVSDPGDPWLIQTFGSRLNPCSNGIWSLTQIAQVNKELKKVFSYKIRKKILLHSIPEFSFLMSEKYHSNLLNTDSLHQTLLTTLVDKALTGSVYMSSITQTKSDNPLFLVAKDYNGILEANKV